MDLRRRSHLPVAAVVELMTTDPSSHESASRGRPGWGPIVAPPVAWLAQGAIGWFIAAHTCADSRRPISPAIARVSIGALTVVAIGIAVWGLLASRHAWQARSIAVNSGATPTAVVERVRFVGMLGLVICISLTLGLALAGLPALLVKGCGEAR
jgi:hypothetical protein